MGLMLHIKRSRTRSILIGDKLDDTGSSWKQAKAIQDMFRGTVCHVTGISSHSTETYEVVTI